MLLKNQVVAVALLFLLSGQTAASADWIDSGWVMSSYYANGGANGGAGYTYSAQGNPYVYAYEYHETSSAVAFCTYTRSLTYTAPGDYHGCATRYYKVVGTIGIPPLWIITSVFDSAAGDVSDSGSPDYNDPPSAYYDEFSWYYDVSDQVSAHVDHYGHASGEMWLVLGTGSGGGGGS